MLGSGTLEAETVVNVNDPWSVTGAGGSTGKRAPTCHATWPFEVITQKLKEAHVTSGPLYI